MCDPEVHIDFMRGSHQILHGKIEKYCSKSIFKLLCFVVFHKIVVQKYSITGSFCCRGPYGPRGLKFLKPRELLGTPGRGPYGPHGLKSEGQCIAAKQGCVEVHVDLMN